MKFIIHRSQNSLSDPQSKALIDQLSFKLAMYDHSHQILNINGDIAHHSFNYFNNNENQQHIIILAGEDDLIFSENFKKMPNSPKVIWSGLTISEKFIQADSLLPDVCVVPQWTIDELSQKSLSGRTI